MMNIIAVDNERSALNAMKEAIKEAYPDANVTGFTAAKDAIEYAGSNRVDTAFLDTHINEVPGLFLAKRLKDIYGDTNIIFVMEEAEPGQSADIKCAAGYMMRPLSADKIRSELDELRSPIRLTGIGLRVQCFGSFRVYSGGKITHFGKQKAEELFAYLVHRAGAECCDSENIAILSKDKKADVAAIENDYKLILQDLEDTLKSAGFEDVLIKKEGSLAIAPARLSCDLYDFCNGKNINCYKGEYMAQYNWAEFVNAYLYHSVNISG